MQDISKTNGKSSTKDPIDLSEQQDSKQENHAEMDVSYPEPERLPMTNADDNQLLVRTLWSKMFGVGGLFMK